MGGDERSAEAGAPRGPPCARYVQQPPAWRPLLCSGDDALGYADYFPPPLAPPADALSAKTVRYGLASAPLVQHETRSAGDVIYERLSSTSATVRLGALFDAVRAEQAEQQAHGADAWHYRPPTRVILNDEKLAAYVRELRDPAVPLARLSRSVPHGLRGERLLEVLWLGRVPPGVPEPRDAPPQSVAVPRALWLVRAVGACEVQALRTRAGGAAAYTQEWTNTVLTWLSRQLRLAPETSAGRARWAAKWSYSLELVYAMRHEQLLAPFALLRWIVEQLRTASTLALPCVLQLAAQERSALLRRAAPSLALVECLCVRVEQAPGTWVQQQLHTLLRICFAEEPAAFVNARLWAEHGTLLQNVLRDDDTVARVRAASAALLLGGTSYKDALPPSDAALVTTLDGASGMHGLYTAYFGEMPSALERRVHVLLSWACTPERTGKHRAYVAAALLREYADHGQGPSIFELVCHWLDRGAVPPGGGTDPPPAAVARLLGELHRLGVFVFHRFLQRLVARGTMRMSCAAAGNGSSRPVPASPVAASPAATSPSAALPASSTPPLPGSLPARVFRAMPIQGASDTLVYQRRLAIYGVRTSESHEEAYERRATRELLAALPWLAAGSAELGSGEEAARGSVDDAVHLWHASPYTQHRVAERLILARATALPTLSAPQCAVVADLLARLDEMRMLGTVLCTLLDRAVSPSCAVSLCNTVAMHARTWDALSLAPTLAAALTRRLADGTVEEDASKEHLSEDGSCATAARAALEALAACGALELELPPQPEAHCEGLPHLLPAVHRRLGGETSAQVEGESNRASPVAWAGTLCLGALDEAATHSTPPRHVLAAVAQALPPLAVRLDECVTQWVRRRCSLDGVDPVCAAPPPSLAWVPLIVLLVRMRHVDTRHLLTRVLLPLAQTSPSHPGRPVLSALALPLLLGLPVPGLCCAETLGTDVWRDVVMLRAEPLQSDALVALADVLLGERGFFDEALRARFLEEPLWQYHWRTHPLVLWRGAVDAALPLSAVRRMAEAVDAQLPPADAGSTAVAMHVQRYAKVWYARLAALELRVQLDELAGNRNGTSTEPVGTDTELDALTESVAPWLFPAGGGLGADVLQMGLPELATRSLATAVVRQVVRAAGVAAEATGGPPGVESSDDAASVQVFLPLARLAQASPSYTLPCAPGVALDALRALVTCVAPLDAIIPPLLAVLRALPSDSPLVPERLGQLLEHLVQAAQDGPLAPLATEVAALVQQAMGLGPLETWLEAHQALVPTERRSTAVSRLLRGSDTPQVWRLCDSMRSAARGEGEALGGSVWARLEAAGTADAATRDPLAAALVNAASVPMEWFDVQKTRDMVPGVGSAPAPPTRLGSERGYGAQDGGVSLVREGAAEGPALGKKQAPRNGGVDSPAGAKRMRRM